MTCFLRGRNEHVATLRSASQLCAAPVSSALRAAQQRNATTYLRGENMAVNRVLMGRWADATRHLQPDVADALWQELMQEWLTPLIADQKYWNGLLTRRMAVLERKAQRRAINDDEWDRLHEDVNS